MLVLGFVAEKTPQLLGTSVVRLCAELDFFSISDMCHTVPMYILYLVNFFVIVTCITDFSLLYPLSFYSQE